MLPLTLLKLTQGHAILVELKNGETYNGNLVGCDGWMNLHLRDVICTSKDGDRFWKMQECYIRGTIIKYIRIPEEIIDMIREDSQLGPGPAKRGRGVGSGGRGQSFSGRGGGYRGGRGGRGGGRGGGSSSRGRAATT